MNGPNWTDVVSAIAAIAIPITVVILGYLISHRLKRIEDLQWRSQALIQTRLDIYRTIAPKLNEPMCYFTFIGTWKENRPIDIIALKRELDSAFYVGAPLFSVDAPTAYEAFMDLCFEPWGRWGSDARLKTAWLRRHEATPAGWDESWAMLFVDDAPVEKIDLLRIRDAYDATIAALVKDIELNAPRPDYTTARVALNAGARRVGNVPTDPDD